MPAKIMLVEDDTNLIEIYQARLEVEGFKIISAKDGEAALALAVTERPDLIVLDVMMPRISGFDMLDILRGTSGIQDTKVIMMTALSQAEDKARAEALGADRYLVKSQVTLEDLVKTVHEVLGDKTDTSSTETPATKTPTPSETAPETPPTTSNTVEGDQTTSDEQSKVDEQIKDFAKEDTTTTIPKEKEEAQPSVKTTLDPSDSTIDVVPEPPMAEPTTSSKSETTKEDSKPSTAGQRFDDVKPQPKQSAPAEKPTTDDDPDQIAL